MDGFCAFQKHLRHSVDPILLLYNGRHAPGFQADDISFPADPPLRFLIPALKRSPQELQVGGLSIGSPVFQRGHNKPVLFPARACAVSEKCIIIRLFRLSHKQVQEEIPAQHFHRAVTFALQNQVIVLEHIERIADFFINAAFCFGMSALAVKQNFLHPHAVVAGNRSDNRHHPHNQHKENRKQKQEQAVDASEQLLPRGHADVVDSHALLNGQDIILVKGLQIELPVPHVALRVLVRPVSGVQNSALVVADHNFGVFNRLKQLIQVRIAQDKKEGCRAV